MPLTLRLFGVFEAQADGVVVSFATSAARALLACLAVSPGRVFTRDALAALLWPDKTQKAAFTNLRQTIVRMKDGLGASRAEIEINSTALRFIPDSADVDVWRFEYLLAECARHTHADGALCDDCVARLSAAVDLYRGEFLQGLVLHDSEAFDDWLLLSREQYRRQVLNAFHLLARHYEYQGVPARTLEFAERQLALEPWHEEAHAQKMRALAVTGQRAAASAQYRDYCEILERELGIGPSHDVRVLFERIQAGEFAQAKLVADLPRHNLPEQLTPFVGREIELADLSRWLRDPDTRLITLTGLGGMGKTRLALEAARSRLDDFAHGVFFVSLATLSSADAIAPAICAVVNCPGQTGDAVPGLMKYIANRQMLLILDNFEHLVAGAAVVAQLLQAAPKVRILVTSRERLNLHGEQVCVVQGLDHMHQTGPGAMDAAQLASVRLFEVNVRRVDPRFEGTRDNLPAVLRIARLVRGMPLGLEMAAAWAGTLTPEAIADEIGRSASFLEAQWQDMPERQRSMRAVFDWSWNLLSADEQAALCKASVFCGAFTRAAAGEIASISLQQLARLIRKSLLAQQDDGRYALHELLRQFASERLDELPALKREVQLQHSVWYLAWLAAKERRLLRNEPVQVGDEIKAEIDNVRQAWQLACQQSQATDLARAAIALWQFCGGAGLADEGIRMFSAAAGAMTNRTDAVGDIALFNAIIGSLSMVLGRHDEALAAGVRAAAMAEAGGNSFALALSWLVQGQALRRKGQTPPARVFLERVIVFARAQRERALHAAIERWALLETRAMNWLCSFDLSDANYAIVQDGITQMLAVGRSLDMRRVVAVALMDRVTLAWTMGDWETLRQTVSEAGRLSEQVGNIGGVAYALRLSGYLARHDGDYDTAMRFAAQARAKYQDVGDGVGDAYMLMEEGRLRLLMGDFSSVRENLDAAERILHPLGEPAVEMFTLHCMRAWLAYCAGDAGAALADAEIACARAQLLDMPAHMGDALVVLGLAQERAGQPSHAAQSFERAVALFERLRLRYKTAEPRAGLARIALTTGDLAGALVLIEDVLALLAVYPRAGADEPFRALLTCWRVLQCAGDARAEDVLTRTSACLHACASHIADPQLRQSFLTNVALHRDILSLQGQGSGLVDMQNS